MSGLLLDLSRGIRAAGLTPVPGQDVTAYVLSEAQHGGLPVTEAVPENGHVVIRPPPACAGTSELPIVCETLEQPSRSQVTNAGECAAND